ncbi:unnamed protein product [Brassica rapa]|uniref:Uncharacterized protein n=2 Tax=Brassica campestris TaxID=3711 RepID=A0A3P6A7L5_BRACM|nr:unnamed protein product [Brassica rapa]VDC89686.1 unnamed protein product [Brassica rapa]
MDECNDSLSRQLWLCDVGSRRVKMHMVDHITTQHRDSVDGRSVTLTLNKRLYKDDSYSAISPVTKKYLQVFNRWTTVN